MVSWVRCGTWLYRFLIFAPLLSSLQEEEKAAGCFAFIVLKMSCYYGCSVALPHCAFVGLQCVIVIFSDHTYLHFSLCCSL